MKYRFIIQEKRKELQLDIQKETYKNMWKTTHHTTSINGIEECLKSIEAEIKSQEAVYGDIEFTLKDRTTKVILKGIRSLSKYPCIQVFIENRNRQEKSKKAKRKLVQGLSLTLGILLGIQSFQGKLDEKRQFAIEEEMTMGNQLAKDFEQKLKEHKIVNINEVITDSFEIEKTVLQKKLPKIFYEEISLLGAKQYDSRITNVHENYGEIIRKYADITGIDAHLLECIFAQERGSHSSRPDPLGTIGIGQIQYSNHINKIKTIYNMETNEKEVFRATDSTLKDLEGNIKTSIAIFQSALNKYNGNTFLALQAYNYGEGAMDSVLRSASKRTGTEIDKMINDPTCLVWLEDVYNYHNGSYGDKFYINHVLSRYEDDTMIIQYQSENNKEVKLETKELIKSR